MPELLSTISTKFNQMGFPNTIVGNTIEATIPLPSGSEYIQPSFKLHYSPSQNLIYFQANRYSTEKLLRKLIPQLKQIAQELGVSFATHEGT